MAELFGCAHLKGCPDVFACRAAGKCAALAPERKPTQAIPDWPSQPSQPSDQDLTAYHTAVHAASIARIKLARNALVAMAANCDECHGERCQYCESTWKVIDQLEVPPWLR